MERKGRPLAGSAGRIRDWLEKELSRDPRRRGARTTATTNSATSTSAHAARRCGPRASICAKATTSRAFQQAARASSRACRATTNRACARPTSRRLNRGSPTTMAAMMTRRRSAISATLRFMRRASRQLHAAASRYDGYVPNDPEWYPPYIPPADEPGLTLEKRCHPGAIGGKIRCTISVAQSDWQDRQPGHQVHRRHQDHVRAGRRNDRADRRPPCRSIRASPAPRRRRSTSGARCRRRFCCRVRRSASMCSSTRMIWRWPATSASATART